MTTGENLTTGGRAGSYEAPEGQPARFLSFIYMLLTCAWQMEFGQAEISQGLTRNRRELGSSLIYLPPQI